MFKTKVDLYTDVDPNGLSQGRVLAEGDPDARFLLLGAGGAVSPEFAARFQLDGHEGVEAHDEAKERAELVAANLKTYGDNARAAVGAAFNGLPAEGSALAPNEDDTDAPQTIAPKRK